MTESIVARAAFRRARRAHYPFTAIVGQEQMKLALLLNAVNPRLGGVLIRGEKGTAKSTAVRALAALLPEAEAVRGCPFACAPDERAGLCAACHRGDEAEAYGRPVAFIEMPVGATEDRVVGAIDLEHAIREGERRFEPGLLAAAHRGILYVDEVNLLNDHLVDVLLDAAAMGRNYVEREGVSVDHPAEFILVGTMNPEEGELRPQLLDRFALTVDVAGLRDQPARAEVVRRRLAFERDPETFMQAWTEHETAERERIRAGQRLLPQVTVDDRLLDLITHICCAFEVDGLRADIVIYKTAQTLAAYDCRTQVTEADVRRAAELALPHRRRRQPFDRPDLDPERLDQTIQDWHDQHPEPPAEPAEQGASGEDVSGDGSNELAPNDDSGGDGGAGDSPSITPPAESSQLAAPPNQPSQSGQPAGETDRDQRIDPLKAGQAKVAAPSPPRLARPDPGRRTTVLGSDLAGHYVASRIPAGKVRDLALDATLRAASIHQRVRREGTGTMGHDDVLAAVDRSGTPASERSSASFKMHLRPADLREKVREAKTGNLILFVVDASGSMAARERMALAKGACLELLQDAYQKRDRVGMIAFRGRDAVLILPPTNSVDLAVTRLRELPTGGRTPLGEGLRLGLQTIERHLNRLSGLAPLLIVLSDWRPNVANGQADPVSEALTVAGEISRRKIGAVVIDGESGPVRLGLARRFAETLGASYLRLEDLRSGGLTNAVTARLPVAGRRPS